MPTEGLGWKNGMQFTNDHYYTLRIIYYYVSFYTYYITNETFVYV